MGPRCNCRMLRLGAAPFLKQWGTYRNNPYVVEDGLSEQQAMNVDSPENGKGRQTGWHFVARVSERQSTIDFENGLAMEGRRRWLREVQSGIRRVMTD